MRATAQIFETAGEAASTVPDSARLLHVVTSGCYIKMETVFNLASGVLSRSLKKRSSLFVLVIATLEEEAGWLDFLAGPINVLSDNYLSVPRSAPS